MIVSLDNFSTQINLTDFPESNQFAIIVFLRHRFLAWKQPFLKQKSNIENPHRRRNILFYTFLAIFLQLYFENIKKINMHCRASFPQSLMIPVAGFWKLRARLWVSFGWKSTIAATRRWVQFCRVFLDQLVHHPCHCRNLVIEGFQIILNALLDHVRREFCARGANSIGCFRFGCGSWLFLDCGPFWMGFQVVNIATSKGSTLKRKIHTIGKKLLYM